MSAQDQQNLSRIINGTDLLSVEKFADTSNIVLGLIDQAYNNLSSRIESLKDLSEEEARKAVHHYIRSTFIGALITEDRLKELRAIYELRDILPGFKSGEVYEIPITCYASYIISYTTSPELELLGHKLFYKEDNECSPILMDRSDSFKLSTLISNIVGNYSLIEDKAKDMLKIIGVSTSEENKAFDPIRGFIEAVLHQTSIVSESCGSFLNYLNSQHNIYSLLDKYLDSKEI